MTTDTAQGIFAFVIKQKRLDKMKIYLIKLNNEIIWQAHKTKWEAQLTISYFMMTNQSVLSFDDFKIIEFQEVNNESNSKT